MRLNVALRDAQTGHAAFLGIWRQIRPWLLEGHRLSVEVKQEKRSTEQNRRMWSQLADISRQVVWHGQKLAAEDWKVMATAALKKQRVVPGIDGGFCVLGEQTSQMTIAQMSELMEFLEAFGAQQGVKFTAPEYATT